MTTSGVPAVLAQRPATDVGSSIETDDGQQATTMALADLLIPRGYSLSEHTVVIDPGTGDRYRVEGRPAVRPEYVAAALRWISDRQEG